jgi:hypothetical protein
VTPADRDLIARGVIVGAKNGTPFGVHYTIICDGKWATQRLDLESTDGQALHLRADGTGGWRDARGVRLRNLDGCVDVDLEGSPFTNTLPIRRTQLSPADGPLALKVLYVPFDSFTPFSDAQVYRCLESGRRYRYAAADGTFAADMTVDHDGLVVDYPPLFHRASTQ